MFFTNKKVLSSIICNLMIVKEWEGANDFSMHNSLVCKQNMEINNPRSNTVLYGLLYVVAANKRKNYTNMET